MSWQTVVDLSLVALGALLVKGLVFSRRRTAPLPPGPKGWPIIGNIFDVGTEKQWLKFAHWTDIWGGLIYMDVFGQPIVIVNSLQTAVEMLDKKSNIYSDRQVLPLAGELAGFARGTPLMPYGDKWRESRRMIHKLMGNRASLEMFDEVQETETHRFLRRVLERPDPAELQGHIRVTAGAIILAISHGYIIQEKNDHLIKLAEDNLNDFSEATVPGAFLVDTFPILRFVPDWFPGTAWKAKAKRWRARHDRMINEPHEYVKQQLRAGTARPSFTSAYLEGEEMSPEKEEILKCTSEAIFGGGSDTTVSSIYSFFLAMTLHPDVQRKAQAEIDAVVGTDRLPTLNDRPHLPYVEALSKELIRWNPVGPLNLPHRLTEDDIQDGYLIPKGTMVIANTWKFLHDEQTYRNPSEFYPERFIANAAAKAEPDPNLAFGLGRRACPGINLAMSSLFLACAMSLSVFNISKAVEDGIEITPAVDYTDGTISHPKPFKCSVKPRSENAAAIIKSVEFNEG